MPGRKTLACGRTSALGRCVRPIPSSRIRGSSRMSEIFLLTVACCLQPAAAYGRSLAASIRISALERIYSPIFSSGPHFSSAILWNLLPSVARRLSCGAHARHAGGHLHEGGALHRIRPPECTFPPVHREISSRSMRATVRTRARGRNHAAYGRRPGLRTYAAGGAPSAYVLPRDAAFFPSITVLMGRQRAHNSRVFGPVHSGAGIMQISLRAVYRIAEGSPHGTFRTASPARRRVPHR